jgi:subfamily B ATP-binding cassette protein MsbA
VYEAFKLINLKHQQLITKTFRKKDLSPILNETLGAGVMLCLVWFGGVMILEAQNDAVLTGKVFLTFIIVFSQLLRPIQGIATNMAFLTKARASQDRINEILNTDERIYEVENPTALTELKTGIRYENVSFKYKDEYVLKNINLTIGKGKTIALVGESGSGKSTLGDLLPRFYDVNEGSIFFDNIPITDCSILDLRNHIGVVSQESILFNTSVRDNIAFGMPNATLQEIENAARIANAHDFIMNLETGYDTNIGERGNKLSGGQKQRISIARAVLKNPTILILDEATSALDTESEKLVQDALDKLMKDRTSIIIAHRLSTIRNADEIVLLSKGEIKERGTHDELIQLKGMYYNLCSLQGIK